MPNHCKRCGESCSNQICIDCRYRNGGQLPEGEPEQPTTDLVSLMLDVSRQHFWDGFTCDQLEQNQDSEL
jgi:hypothetical protein